MWLALKMLDDLVDSMLSSHGQAVACCSIVCGLHHGHSLPIFLSHLKLLWIFRGGPYTVYSITLMCASLIVCCLENLYQERK